MTELSNRNLSLAVRATVVVRRVEPRFDIRFGPSRVKMESLEARRLLSADGLLDFNGIPLPATDSSWTSISLVDETGSTIEAATSDGSVTLLDLVTYEDGTQYYEVSMSSIDPIVFYNTFNDDGGIYPFDPLSAGIEQAEGTPTLDLAGFSDEFPVISLSVSADGVVSAGDVAGVSSDISGSIFLNDMLLDAHVVQQADGSFALASGYRMEVYMRSFSGGMGGETDPSTDPGIMVQAERNVALADFNNWGVTEISVDDNGVVTAIADGQVRTVTLADGERGSIIIDGNDTGYELQQGRESGWTLVPTFVEEPAYYGERTVALADFNNWGVTEIAIDDAGVVTAIADQIARTVTIDEAGIVSVEGVATDFIVYNDGTNTGLQQIYTMVDDFPGDNGGVPEVEAPVHEIFLADFNNWGVTQINVADDGTVTALADSQARAASVDADTREISVDGVATGYTLAQGRESGYTLVASHILYMSNGGPIQNNNGAGPGDIPVLEPTSVPSGFEGEANAFVFISLAPSFTRGESVATGLFASKSIVDQDEQSVL